MLYRTQFFQNHKAKVFIRINITDVDLVQNRNTSRYVEAVNEAESIRSAIRDYLAHRWSLFLNISINKRTMAMGKYIFKSAKGKGKDKN